MPGAAGVAAGEPAAQLPAGAAGAAAGEPAAAAGGGGFNAPSQFSAAVAGVQKPLRQQSSLVPFFQVMPSTLRQLSIDFGAMPVWAAATAATGAASAAAAKSIATLFNFFIDCPLEESRSYLRNVRIGKR